MYVQLQTCFQGEPENVFFQPNDTVILVAPTTGLCSLSVCFKDSEHFCPLCSELRVWNVGLGKHGRVWTTSASATPAGLIPQRSGPLPPSCQTNTCSPFPLSAAQTSSMDQSDVPPHIHMFLWATYQHLGVAGITYGLIHSSLTSAPLRSGFRKAYGNATHVDAPSLPDQWNIKATDRLFDSELSNVTYTLWRTVVILVPQLLLAPRLPNTGNKLFLMMKLSWT